MYRCTMYDVCMNANDDNNVNTATFLADVMIRMITEDPTKIIDALIDADNMIAAGVAEGESKHSLMAEAIMYMFKESNESQIPGLAESMDEHDDEIHTLLVAHLDTNQK